MPVYGEEARVAGTEVVVETGGTSLPREADDRGG